MTPEEQKRIENDMNVILRALVQRIWRRAYLDSEEECGRWIEEYRLEEVEKLKNQVISLNEVIANREYELDGAVERIRKTESEFEMFKKNTAFREQLSIENRNKRDLQIEQLEAKLQAERATGRQEWERLQIDEVDRLKTELEIFKMRATFPMLREKLITERLENANLVKRNKELREFVKYIGDMSSGLFKQKAEQLLKQ